MPHKPKKRNLFFLWLTYVPISWFYHLVRLMPLRAAYGFGNVIFFLAPFFDPWHRRRVIRHLLHTGVAKDIKEARQICRRLFFNFGRLLTDVFKTDQLLRANSVDVAGDLKLARECGAFGEEGRKYRNIIIASAHYGNWEIGGTSWARLSDTPLVSVMRYFSNPFIGKLFLKYRQSADHRLIPKSGSLALAYRALRNGSSLAMLVDQHATTTEGVENVFFGQPCRTHASIALLHLRSGVPIVVGVSRRIGRGFNFEFVVGCEIIHKPTGDLNADLKVVTQRITSEFERLILEQPDQWLWAHRRWLNIHRRPYKAAGIVRLESDV